ncbi:MAG TPA: DUF1634 domain-containing protein [Fimbriimonas sp.]|nr:DUF1634 domain-containing protein [Fimbriimonas sp.]
MPGQDEQQIDLLVSGVLKAGLIASSTLVGIGSVLYLFKHGGQRADYSHFQPVQGFLRLSSEKLGRSIITIGILLLVLTPVARVLLTLVAFAKLKDRRYVAIAAIVSTALIASIAGGLLGMQ